jgi:hypothetical protein
MRPFLRSGFIAPTLLAVACVARVEELGLEEPLTKELSYVWSVRAWHTGELWVPSGDSLDLALLRDRCGVPVGAGLKGCFAEEDSTVRPRWSVADRRRASIQPLPRGSWHFGPASAGARVYGRSPGLTLVTVRLPQGAFADTIRTVPSFDRLRIEPRDSTYVAGDTIRFRVLGLDTAGRVVTRLPWPFTWGRQVGPASADGAIPIVLDYVTHPSAPTPTIAIQIGSKIDTLRFRVLARDASSRATPLTWGLAQAPYGRRSRPGTGSSRTRA